MQTRWNPNILLIEDNFADVKVVQTALHESGFVGSLQVLGSASEAARFLKGEAPYSNRDQHPLPHLILLDLRLPDGHGLDLMRIIRACPALLRTPVIVLTVDDTREMVNSAYDAFVNSYVVKRPTREGADSIVREIQRYWRNAALPGWATFAP